MILIVVWIVTDDDAHTCIHVVSGCGHCHGRVRVDIRVRGRFDIDNAQSHMRVTMAR